MGLKFCSDFFWVRNFGVDKKRNPGFSSVMSNNCIMTQKLSGILLNYYYYFFNWTLLGLHSGPLDVFLGQGLA